MTGEDATTLADTSPDGKGPLRPARPKRRGESWALHPVRRRGVLWSPSSKSRASRPSSTLATEDGRAIYFHANDVMPDAYVVYRYDLSTREKAAVVTEPGLWAIADHRPDGKLLLQKTTSLLSSEYSSTIRPRRH